MSPEAPGQNHPASGRYVNKEDAERYGLKVMVRYAGFKKVMEVTK